MNGSYTGFILMNKGNSVSTLYFLWAVGVNNRNTIITEGPLMQNGNPMAYASTGGYAPLGDLQLGEMDLYLLTPDQQGIAREVADNSFRPCCDNPTSFPDCNLGAAALGLIEIMASQGASRQEIYSALEEFNSLQFPQQYTLTAVSLASRGIAWSSVDPAVILGRNLSSASGFAGRRKKAWWETLI